MLSYALRLALEQVRGRQIRPAHAACDEILTLVPDDAKERVVRVQNATVEIPDEYPDDVRVEQKRIQQLVAGGGFRHRDHRGGVEVLVTANM